MIRANIDVFRQIEDRSIPFKNESNVNPLRLTQMSGVNDDCYIHYYIQQQNTSIA